MLRGKELIILCIFGIGFTTFIEWIIGALVIGFSSGSGLTLYLKRNKK